MKHSEDAPSRVSDPDETRVRAPSIRKGRVALVSLVWFVACAPLHDLDGVSENFGSDASGGTGSSSSGATGGVGGVGGADGGSGGTGGTDSGGGSGGTGGTSTGGDSGGTGATGGEPPGDLCGNDALDPGEDCDDGGQSADCNANCTFAVCGDGVVNSTAGEECDDGGTTSDCYQCEVATPPCPASCACDLLGGRFYAFCGHGVERSWSDAKAHCESSNYALVSFDDLDDDLAAREEARVSGYVFDRNWFQYWTSGTDQAEADRWIWDSTGRQFWQGTSDGTAVRYSNWRVGEPSSSAERCLEVDNNPDNRWNDNECDTVLRFVCESAVMGPDTCGDGVIDEGEACDTSGESSTCDADCSLPVCGDGVVHPGEECDDANSNEIDACKSDCTRSALVGQWPFSEQIGALGYERTGLSAHAVVQGDVLDAAKGGNFASGNFARIADGGGLDFEGDVTVSFWLEAFDAGGFHNVLEATTAGGHPQFVVQINGRSLGPGVLDGDDQANPGDWYPLDVPSFATDGEHDGVLHHYALTCSDGLWRAYLDGQFQEELSGTVCLPAITSTHWVIASNTAGSGFFLDGRIADLRVYDRALTDDEVEALSEQTP